MAELAGRRLDASPLDAHRVRLALQDRAGRLPGAQLGGAVVQVERVRRQPPLLLRQLVKRRPLPDRHGGLARRVRRVQRRVARRQLAPRRAHTLQVRLQQQEAVGAEGWQAGRQGPRGRLQALEGSLLLLQLTQRLAREGNKVTALVQQGKATRQGNITDTTEQRN